MEMYKFIAAAFVVLTPVFAYILINTFKLWRFGWKFPDLALPLFAIEIVIVSGKFFTHNFLPYYLIAMSTLSIVITSFLLRKNSRFSYKRFGKLFWRSGFILTFVFYLILLALVMIA
ncbi:DUF3397 domain-containing protein [Streptococcus henryi]|uniref:DUF3397 domain-containing protein n=1 Tax=Streptococcus henryi TaxID=439219 RepID=UPI00035CF37D|nr:DUF3397 domain-containing protein [Streptococcus henryi]